MFGKFDKTESGLKIVGLVGAILTGISGAAVGTWKILKEKDAYDADKAAQAQAQVATQTTEETPTETK